MLQVFSNLLANAIRFTPEGGRIHIDIREAGKLVSFSVDTGTGIAEEALPHRKRRSSES